MVARVVIASLLAALAACATVPGRGATLLDGRWVETRVAGQGGPVVVFESGLGDDLTAWDQVLPAIAEHTTTFAYSRPGYGDSERTKTERTGRVVVEELRALLRKEQLAPPYVLVGHSLGGLYLQLFARLHPEEIAGLVLVDTAHPAQMRGLRGRTPITLGSMLVRLYMSGTRGREFHGLPDTGEDVLRAPPLVGVPVIILNANTNQSPLRYDLQRLYPDASLRWVDSSHNIPRKRPEAIVEAIEELLRSSRR